MQLHDDESRLIQVVLMITKMMTKSPREYKRMISRTRFKNQEKFDFKIQEKMNSRFKKRNQEDFTREVLKRFKKKTNIAQFCFSKKFFSKFSKLLEFLLSSNRLPVAKFDFKSF